MKYILKKLLLVSSCVFISVINQLDIQTFCFTISLFHASTCFEHVLIIRRSQVHETATRRCDHTRGWIMQFWPPDDEHMCSKHVEAWNKHIVKQKFCASRWLITEINIPRYTVSKTSKFIMCVPHAITQFPLDGISWNLICD